MLLVDAAAGKSQIHGTGLVAEQFIPSDTVVWVLKPGFDVILTKAALEDLTLVVQEQIRPYLYIDIRTGMYILCSDDAKFMNHSDTPNTKTEGDRTWAIQDIAQGEELTADYREFDAVTRNRSTSESGRGFFAPEK